MLSSWMNLWKHL
jgi:hypothetical protein